jgi:hypothetical protein
VGELKEYEVEVNGHRTTMRLTDEEARRYGVDDQAAATADEAEAKAATASASTKARTPSNKSGAGGGE